MNFYERTDGRTDQKYRKASLLKRDRNKKSNNEEEKEKDF